MGNVGSRSRSPGQLSLLEHLRATSPESSDEERIRRLSERLLDEADVRPPVSVEILASLRGIVDIEIADQPWAGMLSSVDSRLVVCVKETDSYPRQRFSILHEAIHTFCPGFFDPQFRCNPSRSGSRLEALCDLGASELLMPRRHFTPDLAAGALDFDHVADLADRYQASLEAAAIRAVDLWHGDASLLVFRRQTKPSEAGQPDAQPKLRLAWSHVSGPWPYLPRHRSVSDGSPFNRALIGEVVDEESSLVDLTSDAGTPFHVSARAVGSDRVLALVRPALSEAAA
jgi:Zn-dependent peptidase ImmA (M78 family)